MTAIMANSGLASRDCITATLSTCMEDPFASPASVASNSPTLPKPCTFPHTSPPSTRVPGEKRIPSTQHEWTAADIPSKYGSVSTTGDDNITTPKSSRELDRASLGKEQEPEHLSRGSERNSKRTRRNHDPEKAGRISSRNGQNHHETSTQVAYNEDDNVNDDDRRVQADKAVKILLFLAGPCVVLSSINTVWACIALCITVLSQPVRLCARRPSFGQQLAGLLGPSLNLQLRCIFTPLPPHANEDGPYHSFMLVVVHLLSPFLSFATMFAAWTLAVYWVSSAVVGDPAGQDKRDDGKETVLGLRNWWERWQMKGVKED